MYKKCSYESKIIQCIFVIVFISNFTFAAEFEVEGNAVYDLYSGHDISTSRTNSFIVCVRGTEWQITTWPLGSSNRLVCAKDTNFLRTVVSQYKIGTNSARIWSNVGNVETGDFPSFDDPFLRALWLTYCSSSYLQSATNGEVNPIWTLDNPLLQKEGFRLRAKWSTNNSPPYLPVELVYISDGVYHGYDRARKQPMEINLSPPYNAGYTCAVFIANSFTNQNGSEIPMEFYFKTSQTPLRSQVTPDMPRDVMFGEVQTIRDKSSVDIFQPNYEGTASIYDYSVSDSVPKESLIDNRAVYKSQNGVWPSGEALQSLVYQYERKVAVWKKNNKIQSDPAYRAQIKLKNNRRLIILFFFLTTLIPLVLIVGKFVKSKKF